MVFFHNSDTLFGFVVLVNLFYYLHGFLSLYNYRLTYGQTALGWPEVRERKPWRYYDRLTNTTNTHKVKVVEGDHVHPEDGGDDYFFKFLEDESFTCSKLLARLDYVNKILS